MSNRLQNQSCRPSPVVWEKHRSKWPMRLASGYYRPTVFSRNWGTILFKIWRLKTLVYGVQKKELADIKKKKRSQHQPSNNTPLPTCWVQTFKVPSPTLYFCTFPDWIKNKKVSSFLLDRRNMRRRHDLFVLQWLVENKANQNHLEKPLELLHTFHVWNWTASDGQLMKKRDRETGYQNDDVRGFITKKTIQNEHKRFLFYSGFVLFDWGIWMISLYCEFW